MYRKRYRKFNRKKRSTLSRVGKYMSTGAKGLVLASTALKVAKQVKSMINVEFKNYEQQFNASVTNAGLIQCLNDPSQGDQEGNRDGDSIRCKSVSITGYLRANAAGTTTQRIRVIIFIDKENNSPGTTDPTVGTTAYRVLNDADYTEFKYIENSNRYKILKDKTYMLNKDTKEEIPFKYYKKLSLKTYYIDQNNDTPKKNGIWFILISGSTSEHPGYYFNTRLRYVDN